jgi:hypothetical protein
MAQKLNSDQLCGFVLPGCGDKPAVFRIAFAPAGRPCMALEVPIEARTADRRNGSPESDHKGRGRG